PAIARRVLAGVLGPVALIERAGLRVVGARRAARLLRIGWARLARHPGARLDEVTLAGGRPAHRAAGRNDVGRTALARSVAGLGQVALARRGATLRPRVAGRMLASDVAAVALVEGAWIAVGGTRRTVRLLGVGRTGAARAGAGLGQVALARHGATLRPRVARRMLAERAAPVTGVGGARV